MFQRKQSPGRPPIPIWDRLTNKIEILNDPSGELISSIPSLGPTPELWPNELRVPWIWIGSTTKRKNRLSPSPRIKIKGQWRPVARLVHTLLVGPIPDDHQYRSRGHHLDVNPVSWSLVPTNAHYPFTTTDFDQETQLDDVSDLPPDMTLEGSLSPEELEELAEEVERSYALRPFTTRTELETRFEFMLDGVSDQDITKVLKLANLNERITS